MVGYILLAIALLTTIPIIITMYLDNKKLRESNVLLESDNKTVHNILMVQGYIELCKKENIPPRLDIINQKKL